MQRFCWNNLNANLPTDVTSASQICISGRLKEPWTLTVNGEGLEQAYGKMDQSESLLHAKFPIVERLQDKIK